MNSPRCWRCAIVLVASLAVGGCTGGGADGDSSDPGGWVLESDAGGATGERDTGSRTRDTAPPSPPPDTVVPDPVDTTDGREDTGRPREDSGGKGNDADAGRDCRTPETIPIRGVVRLHPVTRRVDRGETVAGLSLWFHAGANFVGGGPREFLDRGDCGVARADFTEMSPNAMYFFRAVDVTPVTIRLLASVDDSSNTGDDRFVRTATSLAHPPLSGAVTAETAWAVSRDAEAKLARLAGMDAGDLESEGFIIGRVVGMSGEGIPDLRVRREGEESPVSSAIYPTADLSKRRDSTSASGVFIMRSARFDDYAMVDDQGNRVSDFEKAAIRPGVASAIIFEYTGN